MIYDIFNMYFFNFCFVKRFWKFNAIKICNKCTVEAQERYKPHLDFFGCHGMMDCTNL